MKFNDIKDKTNWTYNQVAKWFNAVPVIKAFKMEGQDSIEMFKTFSILLMEKLNIEHRQDIPTPEEVQDAIKQLQDVPKMVSICAIFLIPLPGMLTSYTLVAYLINKWTKGQVNILPDKFNIVIEDLANKNISLLKKITRKNKDS